MAVIPAKAGIPLLHSKNGIPAFAGMTPVFFCTFLLKKDCEVKNAILFIF
jgi:hypothetical protein